LDGSRGVVGQSAVLALGSRREFLAALVAAENVSAKWLSVNKYKK
jgi:hypothetical protein